MANFSVNWFDNERIEHWSDELSRFKGKESLSFLEIGCFEGRATLWLLKNILTNPSSTIEVIDTFEGSIEHNDELLFSTVKNMRHVFLENISEFQDRVVVHEGLSQEVLKTMKDRVASFDFIYVDGSHEEEDVYRDAILCWPLLKDSGIMAFDDYKWSWTDEKTGIIHSPKAGIDRFLAEHEGQFALIHKRWQLHIHKRPTGQSERWLLSVRWNWLFSRFPLRRSQFRRRLAQIGIQIKEPPAIY
jgi:predicted O-methyltransferase YrrM